ncbi:MAG: peptide deformylase [Betaproteobacteria bacterium TMED156]|nr:MAG: peptide deformylase [Betaproteobacteria bacterium TMED156]|tara:strand:+ start:468 stop:1010 length:543 start_codon:yes stop_codon:yes gene_type:complete
MSKLKILEFPDERLRIKAEPVLTFDINLEQLAMDMAETMYSAPGIGLAATQVNVHKQLIVIDVSEDKNNLLVFINPELSNPSAEKKIYQEGCLSVPGVFEEVNRPDCIEVSYYNLKGERQHLKTNGLLSVCIQHEIDHLKGKVFIDYLSRLKQNRIKKKIIKGKQSSKTSHKQPINEIST